MKSFCAIANLFACLLALLASQAGRVNAADAVQTKSVSLTPGVDDQTVAFWPFDEPQYTNMPLTDAGPNHYDLRLRLGGELVAGRFGNALKTLGKNLPACMFAEVGGQHMSSDITARAVDSPKKILETLAGAEWTWEFWLKLDQTPQAEVAVMHLAVPSGSDDHKNRFYLGLNSGAGALLLRDWGENATGRHVSLPISNTLDDSKWHHLAVTKSGQPTKYRLFVDGIQQPEAQNLPPVVHGMDNGNIDYSRGLITAFYTESNFTDPSHGYVDQFFNFSFGAGRGTRWSNRWRGSLEAPATAEVTFTLEAWQNARLYVDGKLVVDGWSPSKARTGSIGLTQGRLVPIVLEYGIKQDPITNAHLSLSWSWPGHNQELVPSKYFFYSPADARAINPIVPGNFHNEMPRDFEMRLGTTIGAALPLAGCIDELRFSRVARYSQDGRPPQSLTLNYGPNPPAPTVANGPPLLFASDVAPPNPLPLAGNKHLFIDDAILDSQQNLTIASNRWTSRKPTNLRIGGDPALIDDKDQVRLYTTNGDMWNPGSSYAQYMEEDRHAAEQVYTSEDGITFKAPNLGLFELDGNTSNNVVIKEPVQGQVFEDLNPAAQPAARYKFTTYYMTRGEYLYYSPDGIHWKRNETIMLPFDCGGGVESFWDDQRGEYFSYIRNESWIWGRDPDGRAAALARSRLPFAPWSFTPAKNNNVYIDAWDMPSMSTELPIPIVPGERGHVYRARPLKYQWAPDAYLAFVWRGGAAGPHHKTAGSFITDLGVSRDGLKWTYYDPWYFDVGDDLGDGETVSRAISTMGLVRRNNELWNYAMITTQPNNSKGGLYRFTQRLDGFVSLNAGTTTGTATTKPFTFTGGQLKVNVNTTAGQLRVSLTNVDGSTIVGFGLHDCAPIRSDSVEQVVNWPGAQVSSLTGRTVRMQLELTNGKLFAFQFTP